MRCNGSATAMNRFGNTSVVVVIAQYHDMERWSRITNDILVYEVRRYCTLSFLINNVGGYLLHMHCRHTHWRYLQQCRRQVTWKKSQIIRQHEYLEPKKKAEKLFVPIVVANGTALKRKRNGNRHRQNLAVRQCTTSLKKEVREQAPS